MQARMAQPAPSVPGALDLILHITLINAWDRLNVTTGQVPGGYR